MTVLALLFSILLGIGSLAWGYQEVGLADLSRWILVFGIVWLFAVLQRWRWFAHIGLAFSFLCAALGLWFLNFAPGWMFAGAIGGLVAWDLTDFRYRQRYAASDAERRNVETQHLFRITVLALLGFGVASVAMILKFQFNFEWAFVLAVVAVVGITQMVSWFRKRGG